MKSLSLLLPVIFLVTIHNVNSQQLTVGYHGGIAVSDLHGKFTTGRSKSVSVPVTGFSLQYGFNRWLGIGTGLDYTRQEYERRYYGYFYSYYPSQFVNYRLPIHYYQKISENWSFDFIRIPVFLSVSTPTRLQLTFSLGTFLSFQTNHHHNSRIDYPYYYPEYYSYASSYLDEDKAQRHDRGMMYSLSLSYPLNNGFRFFAAGRYFIGRESMMKYDYLRTGVSELNFGLSYSGLTGNHNSSTNDTSFQRFYILPGAGLVIANIINSNNPDLYRSGKTAMVHARMEYRLDKTVSLITGLGFERKQYNFSSASSASFFRMDEGTQYSMIDTKTDLDYAVIPFMAKFRFGSSFRIYFEAGLRAAFNLNSRVTGGAQQEIASESYYRKTKITVYDDIEAHVRDFEVGLLTGTGFEIPVKGNSSFYFGINYGSGSTVFEKSGSDAASENDSNLKTGSVIIHTGFVIPVHPSNN